MTMMTFTADNISIRVDETLRLEEARMTKNMSLIAGYYMIVVCTMGVIENLLVLNTFRRNPKLRFVGIFMVKMLCVYDISMTMCAFPFIIVSCMANEWVFSDAGCQWYGFAMTLLGLGSISSLTCIALERFVVITFAIQDSADRLKTPIRVAAIVCTGIGIAVAILPFVGIGTYEHEPVFLSCSPAWASKSKGDFVFIMILFSCAFLLPVAIITFSYVGICIKVFTSKTGQRRKQSYIKLLVISSLMIAFFLLSWTPYAIFAFLQTFSAGIELTAMENMIPVMMAKSCILWNPLICVGGSEEFRKALKKDLHVMVSCIPDKCIPVCFMNIDKKSSNNQLLDNRNREIALCDNHIDTLDKYQKKTEEIIKVDHNDSGESSTIWVHIQENNYSKRDPFKRDPVKTYTFEYIQCESCI